MEDELSPGTPGTTLGRSHFLDLESGMSIGRLLVPLGKLSSPQTQANPTIVVPVTGPRFQPPGLVSYMSSELRVNIKVARKKTPFIVDTGATFSLNFLLWPNSRLRIP